MRYALAALPLLLCLSFAPSATADDDPRIGSVFDLQGTALVKPVGHERWTPLRQRSVLMPGDLVRTPKRGANAVELKLKGAGTVLLGPGGLIELPEAGTVKFYRGDVEVRGKVVALAGDERMDLKGPTVLHTSQGAAAVLDEQPRWLTGYRNSTTDEWMGSLVANVDGRNVPLTVGYHKVTVDIRDQIARTTVEESFANTTKNTLEGTFYFPLPADASISGFAMWIGDEMVEADIVEKQRARAIYEDILRRREDPGLLEWSGGNLFKARVFPIFPHSEKRIRIRYTQVLPREGSKLRYRYALRSELLRAHPLRELRLKVNVLSAMPIKDVTSPTHECRVRATEHAASVEFDAEEYSPDKDFELAIDLDPGPPLTVVPHRRGEDGYFMLLLSPPDAAQGQWQRDLVPENGALDLLLVADTSGSMDEPARVAQSEFLATLLALLGPDDRFRLMTCDVGVHRFKDEAVAPTEANADAALAWLDGRVSLGWTDLDAAFDAAMAKANDKTVVIYVGDGIGTTGDADPVALAARLERHGKGVCHAVSVSSTFERGVLEAIASIGGGSVRAADSDPAAAAYGLLAEAAQPAVKDLAVSFQGLRTARVYPERLPNLPAGAQQVVLGRFLPTGGAQKGRVVVTGTLNGQPVKYSAELTLAENEEGNSFLPRLWARRHIDALLAQGRTAAVKDEIVAFSEEFGIMTPYTSLLVLESDEQRERYGVTRRVKMRDGERFFAEGRDAATTALLKDHMKKAQAWRLRLRAAALREIATLGKHLHQAIWGTDKYGTVTALGIGGGAGGAYGGRGGFRGPNGGIPPGVRTPGSSATEEAMPQDTDMEGDGAGEDAGTDFEPPETGNGPEADELRADEAEDYEEELAEAETPPGGPPADRPMSEPAKLRSSEFLRRALEVNGRSGGKRLYPTTPAPPQPLQLGFPFLPPPPAEEPPAPAEPAWPADVLALLKSLDHRGAINALPGGLEVVQTGSSLHALSGRALNPWRARGLLGKPGWFIRTAYRFQEPYEQWLAQGERGALSVARRLGRRRDAAPADAGLWPFPWQDESTTLYLRGYAKWTLTVKGRADGVVTLEFTAPAPSRSRLVLKIHEARRVLVEVASFDGERRTLLMRASDLVEVGGIWFATRVESFDEKDRVTSRYRLTHTLLDPEAYAKALAQAVSGHGDVVFLGAKLPKVDAAKQAVFEKKATFADRFVLAWHFALSQQWDKVWEHWNAARALVADKPGVAWVDAEWMRMSRKGVELKELLSKQAVAPAPADEAAADFLPRYVYQLAQSVFQANEQLVLLEKLEPALTRGGPLAGERRFQYDRMHAQALARAGHAVKARALYAKLHAARPDDLQALLDYTSALQGASLFQEAATVAQAALKEHAWLDREVSRIYYVLTDLLWNARDLEALLAATDDWMKRAPEDEDPFQRHLATLLFLGREQEADAWAHTRFTALKAPIQRAALGAAISYALGRGWNYWTRRVEDQWHTPLADLAYRLMQRDDRLGNLAQRIYGDNRFRSTDAYAPLRARLLGDLLEDGAIATMDVHRLVRYLQALPWARNMVDAAAWRRVADAVRARWESANEDEREFLANHVLQLLDAHGETREAVEFLRARMAATPRPEIARQLMARLVKRDWSQAREDELIGLVPALREKDSHPKPEDILRQTGADVRWLTSELERLRYKAFLGSAKQYEQMTRAELREHRKESRRSMRAALVARYATARDAADEFARPWFELERLCFAAQLGDDLRQVDGNARELFSGGKDEILRERCVYVVEYAATRRATPAGLPDAAVAFLQAQAAKDKSWRGHVFRLLLALDRPDALTKQLKDWIVPTQVDREWRIALGYLLAERGKLEQATASFQAVAEHNELLAPEYQVLGDWYLVLDREAKREEALQRRYDVMPEWQLSNRIYAEISRVSRRGEQVPEELDPDVLRAIRALLAKASSPRNYTYQIRNLYRAVKDFRLLESLPYGVIGHTPQGIYPFLERVGQIFGEVHEEATCDALMAKLADVARTTKRTVDRRALLLIEALVARRAADVLNQPGPHADRALKALRAAAQGDWLPGEHRLMASFLASLGRIPQAALAAEQIHQLQTLLHDEAAGGERLEIARHLARTHWAYNRREQAIDLLGAAFRAYHASRPVFSSEMQNAFSTLVGWLSNVQHYARAEALVKAELATEPPAGLRPWLTYQLWNVYTGAVRHRAPTALGQGAELYAAVRALMEKAMWTEPPGQLSSIVNYYCSLHEVAQRNGGVPTAGRDLQTFAQQKLPELLTRSLSDSHNLVSRIANQVHGLVGARAGLAILVDRMENEPAWLDRVGRDGWTYHAYYLARWRSETGGRLGDLEPRLLKLVVAELEADILSGNRRTSATTYHNARWYWRAKANDFATGARRVIELHPKEPQRVLFAARYLWDGVAFYDEAIAALQAAEERGQLRENGRWTLVQWLEDRKRYAEMLPVCDKLLAERPDMLAYDLAKARALHMTGADDAARKLLAARDARLKELGQWKENPLHEMAKCAAFCAFWQTAATYYEELIPLHQRTAPNRGVGRGPLSNYYGELARCYTGLGEHAKAVDAASAAVVAWGRNRRNREKALQALQGVIAGIPDLDAYVKQYAAKAEKTGLDAPLIRKMIGRVYLEGREPAKALPQLRAARDLQPNDTEIHTLLLDAYDRLDQPREACAVLLESTRAAPMQLALYTELGKRLAKLGDAQGSERAWTTVVEMQPNEAESHTLLAQHREEQGRFADAVGQWRQVVRVRTKESPGWFGLAAAQKKAGDDAGARATLEDFLQKDWPTKEERDKARAMLR